MKNELLKLHKSKLIYFLLIVVILFSFAMGFLFDDRSEDVFTFGYGVEEYNTQEELQTLITDKENSITELEQRYVQGLITFNEYERSLKGANTTLEVYRYLHENNLSYDEVQSTTGFTGVSRNKIQFLIFSIMPFELLIIVLSIIITIFMFNYDFSSGVFKFIYSKGKIQSRSKFMLKKALLNFIIILSLSFIGVGLMLILSIPYPIDTSFIIINDGNSVWTLTNAQYVLSLIASHLIDILFWSVVFTALSMLIENTYMLMIASVSFFVIFEAALMAVPSDFTWALTQIPLLAVDFGLSIVQIAFVQIFKFMVAGLLYYAALYYFNKKDLA